MTTSKVPIRTSGSTTVTKMSMVQIKPTYCNVESNARRFPSFPFDHLLTSGSRNSANLCTKKKHSMQKRLFGNKSFFLLPDDQQSYMFLCLLPLSQHVPHVLFSKGFSLKVDNDENYQRLQNTEQVEETTVHWSIPLAQLCVDASPILLYVSELTQPQLL